MYGTTARGRVRRSLTAAGLSLTLLLGVPALAAADRGDGDPDAATGSGSGEVFDENQPGDRTGQAEVGIPDGQGSVRQPSPRSTWVPPTGALFNSPYAAGGRTIADRITRTIHSTAKGQVIRIAMWNFEDGPTTDALLNAHRRGVTVRLITARSTSNPNFTRLQQGLKAKGPDSFAIRCAGACRSRGTTIHAKIITISRVRSAKHIAMIGSINLTGAAATNQWNDMMTFHSKPLYDYFNKTFAEYRADRPLKRPYDIARIGHTQVTLYPAPGRNPILWQLRKVACTGATQGYGNANRRTIVRIAVAAWFDDYGTQIARQVRRLWDQGCDVRVVVTLAGRGINAALKAGGGRGPVPMRNLTVDTDYDGVPNKYLHMKSVSINGVFAGDRSAAVVLSGTPNWTEDSRRADEVGIRVLGVPSMMRAYQRQIDVFFNSKFASGRMMAPRGGVGGAGGDEKIDWNDPNSGFELN